MPPSAAAPPENPADHFSQRILIKPQVKRRDSFVITGIHLRLFLGWILFTVAAHSARAHDPGLSSVTVDLGSREILVQSTFAPADLRALGAKSLADLAPESVELTHDGKRLAPQSSENGELGADNFEFTARYLRPDGEVQFRSLLLARLPFGHRQTFTLRDEAGATTRTAILSAGHDSAALPARAQPATAPSHAPSLFALVAASLIVGLISFRIFRPRAATATT